MWKMDKKVVFLDVDGTMVNEKGEIPESAQYAVRTAQAKRPPDGGMQRTQPFSDL